MPAVGHRSFPKGGVIQGRRDFAETDASRHLLYQPYPYFGSALDVDALSRPPSPPVSEEMFILDPLIPYPEKNWTDDGKLTVESMFTFQNNHDENQEGDIKGQICVSHVSHVSGDGS